MLAWITAAFWFAVKIAIVMAVSYIVAALLAKKPREPGSAGLDELSMPDPRIGRHFPVIFGTPPRDRGLYLFWYGDLYVQDIRTGGGLFSSSVHVAYYYFWGVHFGVSHAGIDGVIQMWYGEKCVWPTINDPADYAADGQATITVSPADGTNLYGGYQKEGGFHTGTGVDVEYGAAAQTKNSYLETQLGSSIPAFRGIVTLVFKKCFWGNSPYPRIISVVTKATTTLTDGSSQWYSAKAAINTYGLNPAHIIRQCLTDTTWGDGTAVSLMGDSFTAVADDLYTEDFGLNYRYYPKPNGLADFIDEVLQTMDGYLYEDHATGKFEIGLCRGDYVIGNLDAFDESDFKIIEFDRPSPGDTPSRVILTYRDRSWPDQRPHALYEDLALMERQGDKVVEQEIDMPGICDPDLANTVVNRLGRAHAFMGAKLRLHCKRTMRNLHWGSVFKISYDDPDMAITQMAVRVTRINKGTIRDGKIEIDVVEDVYSTAETILGAPPDTNWSKPSPTEEEYKYDLHQCSATGSAALVNELKSVSSPSASVSASISASPSASVSTSPSASVSASASEGTPSASISASPSASISASVSTSPSTSPSASVSTSPSSSPS
jgi:hypothetical protein